MRNLFFVRIVVLGLSAASCTDNPYMPSSIVDLCEVEGQRMTETLQSGRQLKGEELGFALSNMSEEIEASEVPIGLEKFIREGTSGSNEFGYYYSSTRYDGLQLRYFTHAGLICKFITPGNRFVGAAAIMERSDGKAFYAFPYGSGSRVMTIEID